MTAPTQTRQPKALDDLAYWLAVKHQQTQQEIAGKTASGLALLWGMLQFSRLDETAPAWLHAVTLQGEQKFRESEAAAFDFVQGTKWAVEPLSEPLKKVETFFPLKDFQLAMQATGPGTVKMASKRAVMAPRSDSEALFGGLAPEVPRNDLNALLDDIMGLGKLNSTGAAVKYVLNGGRGEVQQLVVVDAAERFRNRQAIGWARFTEDSFDPRTGKPTGPCYFCALLASQGAVFLNADSFDQSNRLIREPVKNPRGNNRTTRRSFIGDGPAKVHDHCRCTLRPVYREQDKYDDRANFFLNQWKDREKLFADLPDTGRERTNFSAMNKYRAIYKFPPRYADNPAVNLDAARRNRDLVAAELGEDSPHVRWWDKTISALEIA